MRRLLNTLVLVGSPTGIVAVVGLARNELVWLVPFIIYAWMLMMIVIGLALNKNVRGYGTVSGGVGLIGVAIGVTYLVLNLTSAIAS